MTMFVEIKDNHGNHIGELNASNTDILKYIQKGFTVVSKESNEVIQESSIMNDIGCSDGLVTLND